jgi:hypothetical protein
VSDIERMPEVSRDIELPGPTHELTDVFGNRWRIAIVNGRQVRQWVPPDDPLDRYLREHSPEDVANSIAQAIRRARPLKPPEE